MSYIQSYHENPGKDLHVLDILFAMRQSGLESAFICSLMEHCQRYEGLRDLMEMWMETSNAKERNSIIADLQECLDDILDSPPKPEEKPYLHYDDLAKIKEDVIVFKKQLREEVDRQGGISELARRTGIPQPSLSRFFSSNAMPRRTTLYKIAKALQLPESQVGFKWTS
jgi:DNA-binding phage protein